MNKKAKKPSKLPNGMTRITSYVSETTFDLLVQCMGRLTTTRGKPFTVSSALNEAIHALAKQEGLIKGAT